MTNAARAYAALTKPGITLFIGVVAGTGYVTALDGRGLTLRLGVTLLATMLMSAGAATLNQVSERTWDAQMKRTAARPLPAGIIAVPAARGFGWALSGLGFALSVLLLPAATTVLLALCHICYVYVYTPLKRVTPLCTLTGAIPGALPVLVGWTATGRTIDVAAVALTGVVFMWQIPHFLAIGWMARAEYRSAGFPLLAVVETSGRASARVSVVYALAMTLCAVVVGLTSPAGSLYLTAALMAGATYVFLAWKFGQQRERVPARRLFFSSLAVLPFVLTVLVVDLLLV